MLGRQLWLQSSLLQGQAGHGWQDGEGHVLLVVSAAKRQLLIAVGREPGPAVGQEPIGIIQAGSAVPGFVRRGEVTFKTVGCLSAL